MPCSPFSTTPPIPAGIFQALASLTSLVKSSSPQSWSISRGGRDSAPVYWQSHGALHTTCERTQTPGRHRGNPCASRVPEKQDITVLPASTTFPSLSQPLLGFQGSAGGRGKGPLSQGGSCAPRLFLVRECSRDTGQP